MSFTRCLLLIVLLGVLMADAIPNKQKGSYNHYSAGAAGGGYVQTSGGSYGVNNNKHPYNPPRSSGHSSGSFEAEGGFVAGGGSVSAQRNAGFHNNGYKG